MRGLLYKVAIVAQIGLFAMPWKLRRWCLRRFWKWEIAPSARIGWSLIRARRVVLDKSARIGHFNYISRLDLIQLGALASIGHFNWIYAFSSDDQSNFTLQERRQTHLVLGEHAHLTILHMVDCTELVAIGRYTVVAGCRSNLLTHSPDFEKGVQFAKPIKIGDFCFIGTNVTILGGVTLASQTIVAAGAVVNTAPGEKGFLIGGVPARTLKPLSENLGYFQQSVRDAVDGKTDH